MEPPPETPPPGASKDPQFRFPELRHPQGKSNPNTFCKALIVVALLLVVLLFPSRAPEFVGQGNFNDVWEIFHLLFIGIAVSYGLFCRRTDRVVDRDGVGNGDSDAYLSGVSQLSSFFEGEFDNMCGGDEPDVMRVYGSCQCLMKSGGFVLGQNNCAIHGNVPSVPIVSNGNGENASQTWCSKYLKGESLVVVSNGKYSVDGESYFKPLNLPVRSLRSGTAENEKVELKSRYDSSLEGESTSNDDVKAVKIRGVVPMNLEKFDEEAGTASIHWRSKSGRMGSREERNDERLKAHYRPHSVGEIEFEHIEPRQFLGPKFSSSPELVSPHVELVDSRKVLPVSSWKVAPLNGNVSFGGEKPQLPTAGNRGEEKVAPLSGDASFGSGKMRPPTTGNRGEEKVAPLNGDASFMCRKMQPPITGTCGEEEKVAPLNGDASFGSGKMRPPTTGNHGEEKVAPLNGDASFRSRKMQPPTTGTRGEEEKVAPLNGDALFGGRKMLLPNRGEEEKVGKGKLAFEVESLETDTRSSPLVSKAKSVRTIKPRRYNSNDKEQSSARIDRRPGRIFRKYGSDSMVKSGSEEEPENHSVNHWNHEFDSILSMPNPKPSLDKFSGEGIDDNRGSESEEEMLSELGNSSGEENAKTYLEIDSELEGSEVDRKAGEFIAKFREQIWLQKAFSAEG